MDLSSRNILLYDDYSNQRTLTNAFLSLDRKRSPLSENLNDMQPSPAYTPSVTPRTCTPPLVSSPWTTSRTSSSSSLYDFNTGSYKPPSSKDLSLEILKYTEQSSCRTVYFGGLDSSTTIEQVLDTIKGGIIEVVKWFPERNCAFITFLDSKVAESIYQQASLSEFKINGSLVRVGWGKESPVPANVLKAVQQGASRNVFIGNIDQSVTREFLKEEFSAFGEVDQIKILYEKRIAFVHMAAISQALKAVASLEMNTKWMHRRINYGKDRCAVSLTENTSPLSELILANQTEKLTPNRTVYLGSIHPEATTKDLCDCIRGGILQNIKYLKEKNIAFITFFDHNAALVFYNRVMVDGFSVKGKKVKVGWGKPTPVPTIVSQAVQNLGASRNVYIGSLDEVVSTEKLANDFGEFGEIELVNIISDRNIGFVNFTDIMSAIRAVEIMRSQPNYQKYKINFGKDRCGNPPRDIYRPNQDQEIESQLNQLISRLNRKSLDFGGLF